MSFLPPVEGATATIDTFDRGFGGGSKGEGNTGHNSESHFMARWDMFRKLVLLLNQCECDVMNFIRHWKHWNDMNIWIWSIEVTWRVSSSPSSFLIFLWFVNLRDGYSEAPTDTICCWEEVVITSLAAAVVGAEAQQSHQSFPCKYEFYMILLMDKNLHQLIWYISHYSQGFIYPRWCRISSINSSSW